MSSPRDTKVQSPRDTKAQSPSRQKTDSPRSSDSKFDSLFRKLSLFYGPSGTEKTPPWRASSSGTGGGPGGGGTIVMIVRRPGCGPCLTEARDLRIMVEKHAAKSDSDSKSSSKPMAKPNLMFILNEDPTDSTGTREIWRRFNDVVNGSGTGDITKSSSKDGVPSDPKPKYPIYIDKERQWFKEIHGTSGPTISNVAVSTLVSPWGLYGLFVKNRKNSIQGTIGGEASYLGGLLMINKDGREVYRYKETYFGDTADLKDVGNAFLRLVNS